MSSRLKFLIGYSFLVISPQVMASFGSMRLCNSGDWLCEGWLASILVLSVGRWVLAAIAVLVGLLRSHHKHRTVATLWKPVLLWVVISWLLVPPSAWLAALLVSGLNLNPGVGWLMGGVLWLISVWFLVRGWTPSDAFKPSV